MTGYYHPMMLKYLETCNKNERMNIHEPYFWRDESYSPKWWLAEYVGDQDPQFRTLKYDEVHGEHFQNKAVARYGHERNMEIDQLKDISEKLDNVDNLIDPDLMGWIMTVMSNNATGPSRIQTNSYGFVNLPKVRKSANDTIYMYAEPVRGQKMYPVRGPDSLDMVEITDDDLEARNDVILPPFYPYGFGSIAGMKTLAEASKKSMFRDYPAEWRTIMKTLSVSIASLENLFQMTKNIYPNSALFDEQLCPFHMKTGNSAQNNLYAMFNVALSTDGREPLWLHDISAPGEGPTVSVDNKDYWDRVNRDAFFIKYEYKSIAGIWTKGGVQLTADILNLSLKVCDF